MKRLIFLSILLTLIACEKQATDVDPSVSFIIGHLTEYQRMITITNYDNQDTIFRKNLDTALVITVLENSLVTFQLNYKIMDSLNFTIYVNTSTDNERFISGVNVYSFGSGGGTDNHRIVSSIENSFVIPLRYTSQIKDGNCKLELLPQNEYVRISYESNYTKLSKVKTLKIIN
jgi:hypothetical protein